MSAHPSTFQFKAIPRQSGDFQRPLTAEQIEHLYRHAFGASRPLAKVQELAAGMFNNTFLIETGDRGKIILRVGPHPSAEVFTHEEYLLRREPLLEPHLAAVGHLIPAIIFSDFSRRLINRDYSFQEFLPGDLWDEVQEELSETDHGALWAELAAIALKIHSVAGEAFGFPYPQAAYTRWSDALIAIARMMRDNLLALELDAGRTDEYVALLHSGRRWLDQITIPRLVHGDLWPKNVLIDRSTSPPRIVGLLDGERGFWGDPLAEWIFYYLDIPSSFWEIYGRPADDPGTRFRRLAYRGLYAVQLLLEASRFAWDPQPQHERLRESIVGMQSLL